MANFTVFLNKRTAEEVVPDPIELRDVELGFNQLGWLFFTDAHREPDAVFNPLVVSHVIRSEAGTDTEFVETVPETAIIVN